MFKFCLSFDFFTCPSTHPQKDPHWKWRRDGIKLSKFNRYFFGLKNPALRGTTHGQTPFAITAISLDS